MAASAVLPKHANSDRDLAFTVMGVNFLSTVVMVIYPSLRDVLANLCGAAIGLARDVGGDVCELALQTRGLLARAALRPLRPFTRALAAELAQLHAERDRD